MVMAANIVGYWTGGHHSRDGARTSSNKNCPLGWAFPRDYPVVYLRGGGGMLAAGIDSRITPTTGIVVCFP